MPKSLTGGIALALALLCASPNAFAQSTATPYRLMFPLGSAEPVPGRATSEAMERMLQAVGTWGKDGRVSFLVVGSKQTLCRPSGACKVDQELWKRTQRVVAGMGGIARRLRMSGLPLDRIGQALADDIRPRPRLAPAPSGHAAVDFHLKVDLKARGRDGCPYDALAADPALPGVIGGGREGRVPLPPKRAVALGSSARVAVQRSPSVGRPIVIWEAPGRMQFAPAKIADGTLVSLPAGVVLMHVIEPRKGDEVLAKLLAAVRNGGTGRPSRPSYFASIEGDPEQRGFGDTPQVIPPRSIQPARAPSYCYFVFDRPAP